MTADKLDVRGDHIVLRRDRIHVPIFDPQNLVRGHAIGDLGQADQEVEVLQTPKRLVEKPRTDRDVAPNANGGGRFSQIPSLQFGSEMFAVIYDRGLPGELRFSRARGAGLY